MEAVWLVNVAVGAGDKPDGRTGGLADRSAAGIFRFASPAWLVPID
jgi:hypothetical protein